MSRPGRASTVWQMSARSAAFPVVESALAAGEGEEGFDEVFLLVVGGEEFFGGGPPRFCAGVGVVERDLQQVALCGEGGA